MRNLLVAIALAFTATVLPAAAQDLGTPTGEVILTVSGAITSKNVGDEAQFDLAMLDALPNETVVTENPWYEGPQTYKGVLGSAFLDAIGATGTELEVTALNDYKTTIPVEDFRNFKVILATTRNGEAMPVREKGPIFVIYPFTDNPELNELSYVNRSAWQVRSIVVR